VLPPDAPGKYFIGRLRGGDVAAVGSQPEGAPPAAVWNTYIWVDSADETASKVVAAGGKVLTEPFDVMEAGRMAVCADPAGAVFSVWQARNHRGARIVNEAGSLNFNDLNTPDPEGAKAFYGAVFGWRTLALDGGFEMWTLPGYGDYLEQRTPGMREGMAEMGAPAGFEDVVASLQPIADGQGEIPPHWNVTFAVDDADATAAKAAELGGQVIVPPFDAPWVRMTVITDPQGATFTASKFVPENKDLAQEAGSAVSGR
jgi:predicted enzyme related to lactoylglutathione lyase